MKDSVQIIEGEVAGGVQRVRAELGEVVALAVDSDSAEILHLHGYDLVATIEPGISAVANKLGPSVSVGSVCIINVALVWPFFLFPPSFTRGAAASPGPTSERAFGPAKKHQTCFF